MVNIVDHLTIVHTSNQLILVTLKDRRSLPQFDLYRGRHKSHNKVAQWVQIMYEGVLKRFHANYYLYCPIHFIFRFSFFCQSLFIFMYKKSAFCLKITADFFVFGQIDQKTKSEKME